MILGGGGKSPFPRVLYETLHVQAQLINWNLLLASYPGSFSWMKEPGNIRGSKLFASATALLSAKSA